MLMEHKVQREMAGETEKLIGKEGLEFGKLQTARTESRKQSLKSGGKSEMGS